MDASLLVTGALGAGVVAGVVHASTGPDHLAGVAPFAADRGRRAWRIGVAWGLGHALGAASAAALALLLRSMLPGLEQHLSSISERIVGVLLCAVGALGIHAVLRSRVHSHAHDHPHTHADAATRRAHEHVHWHAWPWRRAHASGGHRHGHAVFALGTLHGVAGLSHLFAVLPALALPGTLAPALYLAGYGAGCLATVTLFAGALGWIAGPRRVRTALLASSIASVSVGLVWIVHPL